jgi:hypothetical protein
MAKLAIKKASTDVTVYLFIQASNVTTGAGLTGLTFETANLVASYVRPGAARAAITLATLAAADSAHSDGGFKEVDATNMPGIYRLDLPDAVCATGVNSVVVMLKGAANMAPVVLEVQLVSYDPNDAVRLGITALPNAAADAAGGLPISDAGALDLDAQIKTDSDDLITRLTAARAGYLDKLNVSGNLAHSDAAATYKADVSALALEATLTAIKGAGWSDQTLVAIDILIDAIKTKTDLIPATPAEVGSAMTLTAAYDKAKDDVLTPLATVDGIVDAIKAKTDNIPASPAPANEYDVRMAAIQADLDNTAQYKADVSGIPEAVMLSIVEGVITLRDSLKLANAALAGKASGGGSGTVIFRDLADTLDRIIATVDEDNNRTVITRDLT